MLVCVSVSIATKADAFESVAFIHSPQRGKTHETHITNCNWNIRSALKILQLQNCSFFSVSSWGFHCSKRKIIYSRLPFITSRAMNKYAVIIIICIDIRNRIEVKKKRKEWKSLSNREKKIYASAQIHCFHMITHKICLPFSKLESTVTQCNTASNSVHQWGKNHQREREGNGKNERHTKERESTATKNRKMEISKW